MPAPRLVVVGSANLDQTLVVTAAPGPGATVSATAYAEEAGGKGLNQALAAARDGAHVTFVGAVGADDGGRLVRAALGDAGTDLTRLREVEQPTGRALIVLEESGENRIVLLAGANGTVTGLDEAEHAELEGADAVLLQLELPLEVVREAAEVAHGAGRLVALTPAPVQPLTDDLLGHVSLLCLNEHELAELAGTADLDDGIAALLERVPALVVTRGAAGSTYADRDGDRHDVEAAPTEVVDTTGAGDTYAGVLVAAYAGGAAMPDAMRRASAAAALTVRRRGTSRAIPTAAETDALLDAARPSGR